MEKILIGKKMTKLDVLKRMIKSILLVCIPYYFVWLLITGFFRIWHNMPNMGGVVALFFLPFVIHNIKELFEKSFVNQYLEVTDDYLAFNQMTEKQTVSAEAWTLLQNKHYQPSIYIKTKDLIGVRLDYRTGLGWYSMPQAILIIECILRDGTISKIKVSDLISKEGQFIEAFNLLEKNGVYISDPHHIKPALEKDNIYFQEYILRLEKGGKTS